MKIAICGSLDFTKEIADVAEELKKKGHKVTIPKTSELILKGEVTLERIKQEKENGTIYKRKKKLNVIRYYYEKIGEADAILVLNYDKKGIKNYIGGNTFLEIGFAHVLGKTIFLLNDIPDLSYTEEIKAMNPVVINEDLKKITGN